MLVNPYMMEYNKPALTQIYNINIQRVIITDSKDLYNILSI